jgi:hypothetical protein
MNPASIKRRLLAYETGRRHPIRGKRSRRCRLWQPLGLDLVEGFAVTVIEHDIIVPSRKSPWPAVSCRATAGYTFAWQGSLSGSDHPDRHRAMSEAALQQPGSSIVYDVFRRGQLARLSVPSAMAILLMRQVIVRTKVPSSRNALGIGTSEDLTICRGKAGQSVHASRHREAFGNRRPSGARP